jgi:catechol 2,3-dioxygenase-like lactoylglutathione lyase family enzyme
MSDLTVDGPTESASSRRTFIKRAILGLGTTAPLCVLPLGSEAVAQSALPIRRLDHVAIPIQNVEAMASFYRGLGFHVNQSVARISVHFGDQKINFHLPAAWQRETFTLRAPAARPPCGDFCWVWEDSPSALKTMLDRAGAKIIEGPGPRDGGRNGGTVGQSVYIRDPDGNLLEFIIYS